MLNIEEIKQLLPHRYPFLMVDRVVDIDPGKSITAFKNVSTNEPFFNGHFPQEAVMPGVMIIEAMAQTAGILGLVSAGRQASEHYLYLLCGLDNTRFRRKVVPGDQVELRAELIAVKRSILKFHCEAHVDGNLVAETDLLVAEQKMKQSETARA